MKQAIHAFEIELEKCATFKSQMRQCLASAAGNAIFLYNVIDNLFLAEDCLFKEKVDWIGVSKTDEFKNWVSDFVDQGTKIRNLLVESLPSLLLIVTDKMKSGEKVSEEKLTGLNDLITRSTIDKSKLCSNLRNLADVVAEIENVSDDNFTKYKIERQLTNLQTRIKELEGK